MLKYLLMSDLPPNDLPPNDLNNPENNLNNNTTTNNNTKNNKHKNLSLLDDVLDDELFLKYYFHENPNSNLNLNPNKRIKIESPQEIIKINKKINNLTDLIELGKTYQIGKKYSIDLHLLHKMIPSLEELNNMIGMKRLKYDIIDHIIFYLQKLDNKNKDMLHTVIEGPPGVGKTELGKILGKIYLHMGILKNNIFKKVSRPDLVAKYLGQTAIKTEELIESCAGGVMFIDEIYSLGNNEQRDSFSKEAIDTLNLKLTEMKNDFVCIVAGYPREIDECFFSYNPGLNSRFPVRFSIDPYTPKELFLIFKKIVKDNEWQIVENMKVDFFKKNYKEFKNYGRDMETLFSKCKRAHSRRIFTENNPIKKLINNDDLEEAFKIFQLNIA
jgi:hypothetical protein